MCSEQKILQKKCAQNKKFSRKEVLRTKNSPEKKCSEQKIIQKKYAQNRKFSRKNVLRTEKVLRTKREDSREKKLSEQNERILVKKSSPNKTLRTKKTLDMINSNVIIIINVNLNKGE